MMKGETRWCSRWIAWYISARFLASRSFTAAWVCLVMSGMSQLFRQASVFDLAASVLSTFIANVSAFVCGSW